MNRNLVNFLLCVLLSSSIWLVLNFSKSYPETESVAVSVRSELEGRAETAAEDVVVSARCNTSGLNHLELARRKKTVMVKVNPSDLEYVGGDTYRIPSSTLYKYGSAIFGDDVSIESFASDGYYFCFERVDSRSVPVEFCHYGHMKFKEQYMASGPVELSPDSVTVYGSPSELAALEQIKTKSVSLHEIGRNGSRGKVRLEIPAGLTVRDKDKSVFYNIDATRFVQEEVIAPVQVHGVPEDMQLIVLPSSVKASVRYVFPKPEGTEVPEFYVDYAEFAESITGKCMVRWNTDAPGVLSVSLSPEICDCIERQKEQETALSYEL